MNKKGIAGVLIFLLALMLSGCIKQPYEPSGLIIMPQELVSEVETISEPGQELDAIIQIEEEIIKDKFGDIKLINYKLRIGHTMGAATAIETALAIQEESGTFLSLGAGMGNVFSSAVVEIL